MKYCLNVGTSVLDKRLMRIQLSGKVFSVCFDVGSIDRFSGKSNQAHIGKCLDRREELLTKLRKTDGTELYTVISSWINQLPRSSDLFSFVFGGNMAAPLSSAKNMSPAADMSIASLSCEQMCKSLV